MTLNRDAAIDVGIVVVLAVLFFGSAPPDDVRALVIGSTYVGALLARRRSPFIVTLVATAAYSTYVLAGYPTHPLGALPAAVAVYTLGQSDELLWAKIIGIGALVVAFLSIAVGVGGMEPLEATFFVAIFVGLWAVGLVLAERRKYISDLEAARSALAAMAVVEERARIARELHDVVSHSLSTMTLQAGIGVHLSETDPIKALESLKAIENTGRSTMEDLRWVLGAIDPDGPDRQPQPTLEDLESLARGVEQSGLDLEFTILGTPTAHARMAQLSIYRIVQESLTNALKHAPHCPAKVTIRHDPNGTTLDMISVGADAPDAPWGRGLTGMAERVGLLGGEFEVGSDDRGWRVRAYIPGGSE